MSTHAFCPWRGLLCLLVLVPVLGCGGNPAAPGNVLNIDQLDDGDSGTNVASGDSATSAGGSDSGSPSALISASTTVGVAPLTVHFDGSDSGGPARIVEYAWDFGDGSAASGVEVFHSFAAPGVYSVQLTVRDVQGATGVATLDISVLPGIRIVATPASASGVCPLQMRFGVAMIGTVGRMPVDVAYHWKFGDGTEGNGPNVVKVYNKPGRYTVTLAAVVGSVVLPGDQLVVTVRDPSVSNNQPPIANAGPDQTVVDANGDGRASVLLDASGSRDPDGHIVWYQWTENVGSSGPQMLAESSAPKMEVQLPVGRHEITLTVADDQQATGQDIVVVSVVARAALSITPTEGFSSSGQVGGVFSPQQAVYTLKNGGQQALEWTASCGQNWLDIVPASGALAGGQTVQVTVSIGTTPAALGVGTHLDAVNFTNRTNGIGSTSRVVRLTVIDPALPTIAGRITEDGVGVPDVVMEGLPGEPKTDDQGYYSAQVPLGWSGLVLPTKVDYTFAPPSRRYNNITADQPGQDYAATAVEPQFADHVSQYGITWTFDKPYRVGQFVNGDWWVCPDTPEGTVLITDITRPHRDHLQHELDGSQINPTTAAQGYDSRESGYNSAVNAALALPVALMGDQSLVSSISWVEGELGCPSIVNGKPRPLLRIACVLTCLGTPPPADAFRPSAYGNNKTLYRTSMIRWERLPALSSVGPTPTLASLEAKFGKFRLDQIGTYSPADFLHPSEAMPWYGAAVCSENGDAALRLCLNDPPAEKATLLIRYVQYGIDLHGAARSGTRWRANGGIGPGRKLPILFAGLMLDDASMLAVGRDYTAADDKFAEDAQTWYVNEGDIGRALRSNHTGTAQGGSETTITLAADHPSSYSSWIAEGRRIYLVAGKGAGQMRVATAYDTTTKVATVSPPWDTVPDETTQYEVRGYEADHVGMPEYGIRHAAIPSMDCPTGPTAEYRAINGNALRGAVLAARLLGLKVAWNHDALFDYMDRYYELTAPGGAWHPRPAGYQSAFAEAMWLAYRNDD